MNCYDVIIVGNGLSAYAVARKLSSDLKVAIITKYNQNSNSMLAQGGIAAVFNEEDHWSYHKEDTLQAGDGHSNTKIVSYLVQQGPRVLKDLISEGMRFDRDSSSDYLLGKEGAHSHRRILHSGGDATGKNLMSFLHNDIAGQIDQIECVSVISLMTEKERCIGIKILMEDEEVLSYYSEHVILATGGCGNLYEYTSNSDTANGEGLSLAYYAGAELVDLEFVQFHPTILSMNTDSGKLISEAVRGEGAVLVDEDGERIMKSVHLLGDLAPRDIVAREVYKKMMAGDKVYLLINHVKNFTEKFPTITAICRTAGVDLSEGLIPIRPGAHFHMGGVRVNEAGQTTVSGLYAVGEVACSGVHGANRLASNSLLEGLVMGEALANFLNAQPVTAKKRVSAIHNRKGDKIFTSSISPKKLKKLMMGHVGIERSSDKLRELKLTLETELGAINSGLVEAYQPKDIPFIHQLTAAFLITKSAFERKESRGAHYCLNYPEKKKEWEGYRITQKISKENGGKGIYEYVESKKDAGAVFT